MQPTNPTPPKAWPFKSAFVPLPDNGGTSVDEADMPVGELQTAYDPEASGVEHGDAQA